MGQTSFLETTYVAERKATEEKYQHTELKVCGKDLPG